MKKKTITVIDDPGDIFRFIETVTYRYETPDTRILMETIRQSAKVCFGSASRAGTGHPIMEMACDRERLIEKLKHHTKDFITWWCLLRCLYKYGDPNNLVNHERGKWISLTTELCGLTSTEGNTQRIKKKFLDAYWKWGTGEIEGEDYDTKTDKVIAVIYNKFAEEGITDTSHITDVAAEFGSNVDEFIRIISSGDFAAVTEHANAWFPSTVEPQRPRRGKRRRRK